MTATNHALTGAIIGASIRQPWLALPLAFLSHYVLDAIPHFGAGEGFMNSKYYRFYLMGEALLCFILVATLVVLHHRYWLQASICAFLATSPDLFWINRYGYILGKRTKDWKPGWHSKFASVIQWFEKPIGAGVELVWFFGALAILSQTVL